MKARHDFEQYLLTLLRHRPVIHVPSALRLSSLCQQQLARETNSRWTVFWSLASRYFNSLKRAPNRVFGDVEAAAVTHILNGLLLRSQAEAESPQGIQDLEVVTQLLFLDQADVLTQRVQQTLQDCADAPDVWPDHLADDARSLALLAQDMSLSAVQQVADALATQLTRLQVRREVDDVRASQQAAQEISRLLHQFASGSVQSPQVQVLEDLRTLHG